MTPLSAALSSSHPPKSEGEVTSEQAERPGEPAQPSPGPGVRDNASERAREVILIVDDDPSVLHVASSVLERGGYEVLAAAGGVEALALAEEYEGPISLLLTDVVMPGMGGRELSEIFRARYPSVRILFMSAYTEDEVILQGVRVEDEGFIAKPYTVQRLRDKIRQALDRTEEGS